MEPVVVSKRVIAVLLLVLPALLAAPNQQEDAEDTKDAANYDFEADLEATARGQGFFDGFSSQCTVCCEDLVKHPTVWQPVTTRRVLQGATTAWARR